MHLVRAELPLLEAALVSDDVLAVALGCEVVPGWATFAEALEPTRDGLVGKPDGATWGPRFFVADDPPQLVGWGGFKGPPRNGAVELGYEIAESRRRRGHATAAVRAMVAEAFAAEDVTTGMRTRWRTAIHRTGCSSGWGSGSTTRCATAMR